MHKMFNVGVMFVGLTATFIGHRDCYGVSEEMIKKNITALIEKGYDKFLNGSMGAFDRLCSKCVFDIKCIYPHIKNIVVIPYLSFKIECIEYFDDIVYPDGFEKYYFKSAIIKRNEYLVDKSDAAICFVEHSWGGAAKTFAYANKRKSITIINLAK